MTLQRMDHVGIVVDDLAAATEFFAELGLELQGEGNVDGRCVDRVVGLEGVRVKYAMMRTPDGNGGLELIKFHSPPFGGQKRFAPANTPGIRHLAFAVEDIDDVIARLQARGAELVGGVENFEDIGAVFYKEVQTGQALNPTASDGKPPASMSAGHPDIGLALPFCAVVTSKHQALGGGSNTSP